MRYWIYECTYKSESSTVKILRVSELELGDFTASLERDRVVTAAAIESFEGCCELDIRRALKEIVSCRNILGTYFWGRQKYVVPQKGKERRIFVDFEYWFVKEWKRKFRESKNLENSFWETIWEFKCDYRDLGKRVWNMFWKSDV